MKDKFDKIFHKHHSLKEEEVLAYLRKQLSAEDTHRLEESLANSEFYTDAVEGLEIMDESARNRLMKYIREENINLINENSSATDWKQFFKIAVAAGIAILIGLFFLFKADDIEPSVRRSTAVNSPSSGGSHVSNLPESHFESQRSTTDQTGTNDPANSIASHGNNYHENEEEEDEEDKSKKQDKGSSGAFSINEERMAAPAAPPPSIADSTVAYGKNTLPSRAHNKAFDEGLEKFKDEKYEKAILLFEQALLADSDNQKAAYYCGLAHYRLANYRAAYIKFSDVANAEKNNYTEDALWFKAQTLINLQDIPTAKIYLQQIISSKGKYQSAAEQLLITLK